MMLSGKVAVVTGAARGLGRAYALRLARLGADVAILDIDLKGAAKFGEELGAPSVAEEVQAHGRRAVGLEVDVADRSAAEDAIEQVHRRLGPIDILVNNAGGAITDVAKSGPSVVSSDDIATILNANLMSTIHCCQAVAPVMKERRAGIIVNTASTAARIIGSRGSLSHYGFAKEAVVHYTRSLAAELGPYGVRVNAIAPGIMMTARVRKLADERGIGQASQAQRIPLGRLGEPDDCAGVLEFLVTDLSRYVTGQSISVCGGAALSPS
ncbi:MAG: SDR family oxidoreductase [Proteobacteria bacterium]|nr:SDR family oxidoreductase [Pseudomonadota bacterium]